jgi:hypothetical protein
MGWYAGFRPVAVKEEVLEPLEELIRLCQHDEDEALEKGKQLFPDIPLSEEVCRFLAEADPVLDEGKLWTASVRSPDLDTVLPFLGHIARPRSLIVLEVEDELPSGWLVQEDGSLQGLVLGFVDPETGRYWLVE